MSQKESLTTRLERQVQPPSLTVQLCCLFLPFVSTAVILLIFSLLWGKEKVGELAGLSVASFVGFGKFIVFLPLSGKLNYSPWFLAGMVNYMDLMTAFIVTYNLHLLNKIPKIGPKLKDIRKDCYYLLQSSPWMRRVASTMVVLFVAFPVSGTGAIAGSFLALLLGLPRVLTVIMIGIGGFLGSYGMALGAILIGENLKGLIENWIVSSVLAAILIALIVWASWKMKKMIREQKEKELAEEKAKLENTP